MEVGGLRKLIQILVELYLVGFFSILFLLFFLTDFSLESLYYSLYWPYSIVQDRQSSSFWFIINILLVFYGVYVVARISDSADEKLRIFKIVIRKFLEIYSVGYFLLVYISIAYMLDYNTASFNNILRTCISYMAWIYQVASQNENLRYFYLVFLSLFYIVYHAITSKKRPKDPKNAPIPSQKEVDRSVDLSETSIISSASPSLSEKEKSFFRRYFILFDLVSIIFAIFHFNYSFRDFEFWDIFGGMVFISFFFVIFLSVWITKKTLRNQLSHLIHPFQRLVVKFRSIDLKPFSFYFTNFRTGVRMIALMHLGIDAFFGLIFLIIIIFKGDLWEITLYWWILSVMVSSILFVVTPLLIINDNQSEYFFFSFT